MNVPVTMHKAEKYAISTPEESVRVFFMQSFGCVRKVYNLYVDFYYDVLKKSGYISGDEIPEVILPEVTFFKKAYPYLKDADSLALANAKIDFESAVKRYRKEYDHKSYTKRAQKRAKSGTEPLSFKWLKGMPKFHSKARGYFSYKTNCQYPTETNNRKNPTVRLEGNLLYLPKIKKAVRLIIHRPLPDNAVIGNVTISMDTDGKFYASVEYSYTLMMDLTIKEAVLSNDSKVINALNFIGLDYSQPDFYVDSEERKANYPHYYRKAEKRLARLQRQLSHMEQGSANYNRQLGKIQKLHKKIRDQRKDFIRKEAHYLSSTYDVVVVEDINLNNMGQALSLGKNLHDNGFGMFRERLSHKLEEKGSVLVKVDRSFASTKTCSACGNKNQKVVLGVSEWTCPVCGAHHLRDENAAVNIKEEGRRIFIDYYRSWLEKDTKSRDKATKLKAARKKQTA